MARHRFLVPGIGVRIPAPQLSVQSDVHRRLHFLITKRAQRPSGANRAAATGSIYTAPSACSASRRVAIALTAPLISAGACSARPRARAARRLPAPSRRSTSRGEIERLVDRAWSIGRRRLVGEQRDDRARSCCARRPRRRRARPAPGRSSACRHHTRIRALQWRRPCAPATSPPPSERPSSRASRRARRWRATRSCRSPSCGRACSARATRSSAAPTSARSTSRSSTSSRATRRATTARGSSSACPAPRSTAPASARASRARRSTATGRTRARSPRRSASTAARPCWRRRSRRSSPTRPTHREGSRSRANRASGACCRWPSR